MRGCLSCLLSSLSIETGSLTESRAHRLTRLAHQRIPGIHLSLSHPMLELEMHTSMCQAFFMLKLKIQTQGFMFLKVETLYSLSHLPSPECTVKCVHCISVFLYLFGGAWKPEDTLWKLVISCHGVLEI